MSYTALCSNFFFPIQSMLKGHSTVAWLKFLEKSQWWSSEQLASYSEYRLKNLYNEVTREVPYYKSSNQFEYITKQDIRNNFNLLKSNKIKNCHLDKTGGSTGEPLHFLISKQRVSHDVAAKWRVTRWYDVDIGDPELVFWGSPHEISKQSILRSLRDYMFRSHLVPARHLDDAVLETIIRGIKLNPPKMLFGYPSLLSFIASYADKKGYRLNNLGIRVAFVTSEVLDFSQRAIIEAVFGCKVANGYGGRESGFIAHECPSGSMHITSEDLLVEIRPEKAAMQHDNPLGEIVITHFETADFPFIRYRTGDYAKQSKAVCPCGRKHPVLSHIEGRQSDLILSPSGGVIHRAEFVRIITAEPSIERFKVVQETMFLLHIFVKSEKLKPESIQIIKQKIAKLMGEDVTIKIEVVSDITPSKSGKYQFLTSKVSLDL